MKTVRNIITSLVIIVCLLVASYAGYQLYKIWSNYKAIDEMYGAIEDEYTNPVEDTEEKEEQTSEDSYYEYAVPPIEIDWDKLLSQNKDIVGWVYIDATKASYPIAQGKNNQYYLHRKLNGDYFFAGTIFLSASNSRDFSDANSIVYGHNMKNGSMFGKNQKLKDQETYDKNPYFWILTPNGNYRYHIYSVTTVYPESDPYILWKEGGKDFLKWEKTLQKQSVVKNKVELKESDHTVILSCCESNHTQRTLVVGRCCSRPQPPAYQKGADND